MAVFLYFTFTWLPNYVARRFLRHVQTKADEMHEPTVSLIIAAYNEEAVIGKKLKTAWARLSEREA